MGWFSLQLSNNCSIEPARSAGSLLPRDVVLSGMRVLGAGNSQGLTPGRNFSSQELSVWEFLLSRIRLGACRKFHFCHCSGRPSLSTWQLLSLLHLSTELLTWKRESRDQGGSPGHLICCEALTWKSVEKALIPVKTRLCSRDGMIHPCCWWSRRALDFGRFPPSSKVGWEIPGPAPVSSAIPLGKHP